MSEKVVLFRANQELQGDDLTNMQKWGQEGVDHVVLDTIEGGKAYSGFTLTKASVTQLNVAAGRLYNAGSVYAREETVTLDFYNDLPVATQRYFAVVAWGQTVDEDIQPRNYLLDADTGEAEPQSVAMQQTRYCNINYVKGTESADPQYPNVDATTLLIGYVLCDPSGINTVVQATENQIDNLSMIGSRVTVLEGWRGILAGMVDTLRTDLANLARQLLLYTPLAEYQNLVSQVSHIDSRLGAVEKSVELISGLFLFAGRERFFDEGNSDTTLTLDSHAYNCRVAEGLRFPGGPDWSGKLELLNPSEPMVQAADTLMIPTPSGARVRYDCSFLDFPWVEHRILAAAVYHPSFLAHHLYPTRWRFRCGPFYTVWPGTAVWWYESFRDPVGHILSFVTETWEVVEWGTVSCHNENDIHWPRHGFDRWKYYWRDWVHLPHWDKTYTDYNHSGNHMAQSFFNAQDGWLNGITVFLMKPNYGPMNILITGCDEQGAPDSENHTIRRVVLDADAVATCVEQPIHAGDIHEEIVIPIMFLWWTIGYRTVFGPAIPVYVYPCRIPITPVFLRAGQHYAFHIDSTYDHYFAVSDRDDCYQVHQGHVWHYDGSALRCYTQGPLSMRFKLHFCTWGRWGDQQSPGGQLRYEINLQPLLLAGGIGSVDILAEHIIPEATDLSYEIQVGGVWKAFAGDPNNPQFTGAPTQLPFRVVMTGTTDLMPAFSLDNSQVTLHSAPGTVLYHFTKSIACSSTSCIKVIVNMANFVEANHDLDCSVHYNSTHHAADTVADKTEEDGTITRTFTHNVSAVTSFRVELHGVTNHTGDDFFVTKAEYLTKAT